MSSPLRGRGIDYARVPTTGDGAEQAVYAVSWVLAILGGFDRRTQAVLVGSAMGLSFREIATQARDAGIDAMSATTCRRLHRPAWDYLRARLIELHMLAGP